MQKLFKVLAILAVITTLFLLTTAIALAQDPDNGKVVWEDDVKQCQACHGPMGEGKVAGPLAGNSKDASAWVEQVRNPRNMMPHFSTEQISDEQIMDAHAYLTSLAKPDSFSPTTFDLPDDAPPGQVLIVEKRCAACHGITGPVNGFIQRGETPTVERIVNQLRTPFRSMPAYSESQVSEEEAALITDFLVSQMPAEEMASDEMMTEETSSDEMASDEMTESSEEMAPETLPQSGGNNIWLMIILISGGALATLGLIFWRLLPKQ